LPALIVRGTEPDGFAASLVLIESGAWHSLHRCKDCGQHWRLEHPDRLQTCVLVKLTSSVGWSDFDQRPLVIEHMLRSRGGYSHEKCAWQVCVRRAMKRAAYCPDHWYSIGQRS
jgi:hypothetical protein